MKFNSMCRSCIGVNGHWENFCLWCSPPHAAAFVIWKVVESYDRGFSIVPPLSSFDSLCWTQQTLFLFSISAHTFCSLLAFLFFSPPGFYSLMAATVSRKLIRDASCKGAISRIFQGARHYSSAPETIHKIPHTSKKVHTLLLFVVLLMHRVKKDNRCFLFLFGMCMWFFSQCGVWRLLFD